MQAWDGLAKKCQTAITKKMRRLDRLIGIDEEHCCRDIGIVPAVGLLKIKAVVDRRYTEREYG